MRTRQIGVLGSLVLLLFGPSEAVRAADEVPSIRKLRATYDVSLSGFNLGEFRLAADFNGPRYALKASAKFSILGGLVYEGNGTTNSDGRLTDTGPRPQAFEVRYVGGDKNQRRFIQFADGAVSKYGLIPKKRPNPKRIPLSEGDLENVLDPLTAGFLSVRSDLRPGDLRICQGSARVFDGQQRFDITLSPKRTETLPSSAPSVLPRRVAVCRVRFVPVSGYRPDHPGIKYMQKTEDVEVWLVSLPQDRLYLPYRISVPTAIGPGSATLTEVKATPR